MGGLERDLAHSIDVAFSLLKDWENTRGLGSGATPQNKTGTLDQWKKPSVGELKCNVGAALFIELGCFGIGMCIRDETDMFIKSKTIVLPGVPLAQEAEAWGLLEAIKWLGEIGVHKVTIELDCKPVVDGVIRDNNHHRVWYHYF